MMIKYWTSHPLGPSAGPYDCINVYACIRVNFLHFGADDAALGAIFYASLYTIGLSPLSYWRHYVQYQRSPPILTLPI